MLLSDERLLLEHVFLIFENQCKKFDYETVNDFIFSQKSDWYTHSSCLLNYITVPVFIEIVCVYSTENPGMRRSYQNMSRLPQTSAGQYGSDPYLDNYSSGGSDDYEQNMSPKPRQISRLQPPNRSVSPNVSGLRQPSQRGPSPQRTGLPQPSSMPRRTIPRPESSRIATPVKR